ncbi:MAG: DUF2804 domain-containing protein, partial [Bacilli bacterium]
MQKKLSNGKLLNEFGNVHEAGYAFDLVKEYQRSDIKAPKSRIKEWDYYYIGNNRYGVALTIADNSYMGLIGVTFFDFKERVEFTKNIMLLFTRGKLKLPSTSQIGNVEVHRKDIDIVFENDGTKRHLTCRIPQFTGKEAFECAIDLINPSTDSMVIVTPFHKSKYFYYNQKINCLKGSGFVKIGTKSYDFSKTLGVLDWGRGVWTYHNTWYWSSLSTKIGSDLVGFNLGYGFGDTSAASENMLFLNGIGTKIDQVFFNIPHTTKETDDFMSPWTMTSNDGAVDL